MNHTPHLHKRPQSQHWQVRLMIPKAARATLGRAEFTKSLGVSDKRQAVDLSHAILAEWKAVIANALAVQAPIPAVASRVPTEDEINQAALEIGFEGPCERAKDLVERKARLGSRAHQLLIDKLDERYRDAIRQRRAGDHSFWIERARKVVESRRWALSQDDPAFATLVHNLATGGVDTLAYAKAMSDGSEERFVASKFVTDTKGRRAARALAGESISELYEMYASQRLSEGRKRTDTINQDRKVIQLFECFVGADRSLPSIQAAEVREWRNAIAALPPAFRKRKENARLTMRESSDKARRNGLDGMSPTTVNKYLSTVSPLFNWARQEGYVEHNPCDGLFYDIQKNKKSGKSRRPPFSIAQLNTIFSSPLFLGFARNGKEWVAGNCHADDWRKWIPLVCLFTGARIGEIAQLRVDDVRNEGDLSYLWIKDDHTTGQQTKSGYCRPAPVHSKLVDLGWLSYVEKQRERASRDLNDSLFPEIVANSRGQISWTPSRFWRSYLTHIGIKSGRDGYGSHSFRHGLADQLRLAGYLDDEVEIVLGHNQVSVTAGYGQVKQGTVKRLNTMIEAVTFEGINFPFKTVP